MIIDIISIVVMGLGVFGFYNNLILLTTIGAVWNIGLYIYNLFARDRNFFGFHFVIYTMTISSFLALISGNSIGDYLALGLCLEGISIVICDIILRIIHKKRRIKFR